MDGWMDGWMDGRMGGWEGKCLRFPLAPHLECLSRAGPDVTGPFSPQSWDSGMHGGSAVSRGLEREKRGSGLNTRTEVSASKVTCEDWQPPRLRGALGAILWHSCRPDTCGCWSCDRAARGDWSEVKQGANSAGETPRSGATYLIWPSSQAWNLPPRLLTAQGLGLPGTLQPPFLKSQLREEDEVTRQWPLCLIWPGFSPGVGRETPWTADHQTQKTLHPGDSRPTFPPGLGKVRIQKTKKSLWMQERNTGSWIW